MTQTLYRLLEDKAGGEEFQWRIPNSFLPPRFKKLADGKDMLLVLERNYSLNLRIDGEKIQATIVLTPGKARQLLKEITNYCSEYGKQARSLSSFVKNYGEYSDDYVEEKKEIPKECPKIEKEETVSSNSDYGGENPFPISEEIFCG